MKQFIVLLAIFPVMMLFLLQFAADQRHGRMIGEIQEIVYSAKELAKQEGYFSTEICNEMREGLSRVVGVGPEGIIIESPPWIKNRYGDGEDRLIYFKVSIPIRRVMAGSEFFGWTEEENTYQYVIDSYTASERI